MTRLLDAFLAAHADIAGVSLLRVRGSSPREAGAEMLVAGSETYGTIGGGRLEYMAIERARTMLAGGENAARMDMPLGPEIGQCCGGRVEIALARLTPPDKQAVRRRAAAEKASHPAVLIFGAGHVGRALAATLASAPLRVLLIDSRAEELAKASGVETRLTPLPEAEVRLAPPGAACVVATHDHALDFQIVAEALSRTDMAYTGMIGSATKRGAFLGWLRSAHPGLDPGGLVCPIGAMGEGDKRPEVIALHTAAEVMAAVTRAGAIAGSSANASLVS